jgi:hypothetical protein
MKEIWKDLKYYEGVYQVSNLGRVKSLHRKRRARGYIRERILKPQLKSNGYIRVSLWKNGQGELFWVHILVAKTFILNINNKPEVNHKDGIRSNNEVENLEWVTYSENIQHSYDKLGRVAPKGEKSGMSKLTEEDVAKIRNFLLKGLSQRKIAKLFKVVHSTIGSIHRRKTWL